MCTCMEHVQFYSYGGFGWCPPVCPVPAVLLWNPVKTKQTPFIGCSFHQSWTASCHWPVSWWDKQRWGATLRSSRLIKMKLIPVETVDVMYAVFLTVPVSLQEGDGFSRPASQISHTAHSTGSVCVAHWLEPHSRGFMKHYCTFCYTWFCHINSVVTVCDAQAWSAVHCNLKKFLRLIYIEGTLATIWCTLNWFRFWI